jgi:Putative  PD-(D/E)XK family member, (DUF4420)
MNWSTDEIVRAVLSKILHPDETGDFSFPLYNAPRQVGIGVRSTGELVLMLPQQSEAEAFEAKYAQYSPAVDLYQPGQAVDVVTRSLLYCQFEPDDLGQIQAIAAVFAGLVSLERSTKDTAQAIWAMKGLFDSGFNNHVPMESIKGLFGELAVLHEYNFSKGVLTAWHSDPNSKFDITSGNTRLEVKTTSGAIREHHFSEGQVPGPSDVDCFVASVMLQIVNTGGVNLGEYLFEIQKNLSPIDFQQLLETCASYLKANPFSIQQPRIDIRGTLGNIRYYQSPIVPHPNGTQGTSDISWRANLSGLEPETSRPSLG